MSMHWAELRIRISVLTLGVIFLAWAGPTSPVRAAESDSPFPVRVSTNGRYLVDASGTPFLLHGVSPAAFPTLIRAFVQILFRG
jgi:hypothetical protein